MKILFVATLIKLYKYLQKKNTLKYKPNQLNNVKELDFYISQHRYSTTEDATCLQIIIL